MIHLNRLYAFSVNTTRAQSIMCTGWNICSCELQLYQSAIHLRTTLSFQTQLFLCTIVQLIIIFEYICTVNDFFEYICTVNDYFRVHLYTKIIDYQVDLISFYSQLEPLCPFTAPEIVFSKLQPCPNEGWHVQYLDEAHSCITRPSEHAKILISNAPTALEWWRALTVKTRFIITPANCFSLRSCPFHHYDIIFSSPGGSTLISSILSLESELTILACKERRLIWDPNCSSRVEKSVFVFDNRLVISVEISTPTSSPVQSSGIICLKF